MELIITRRNGDKYTMLYDECDKEWVENHSWCVHPGHNTKYATSRIKRKLIFFQKAILGDIGVGMIVDHINSNGLDNRRCNLRICTPIQNRYNKTAKKNGASKYLGVMKCGYSVKRKNGKIYEFRRWKAVLIINKEVKMSKTFKNEIDAAIAYNYAAIKYFGEFAKLNIIYNEGNSCNSML